ncbi:MAG: S41 family peptidase [Holosporales bacterium]|jgi:carboxyl-terminal processing protease|nr:S41 family peptidase [Holosporales bacterium]
MKNSARAVLVVTALCVVLLISCKKKEEETISLSIDSITTNTFIKEIIEEISSNYADDISREKLEIGAINGILGVLDEHSMYISQDEFSAFTRSTRGTFLGIGVEIKQTREGVEVTAVIDDSPASTSGLRENDLIVKIDDRDISEMHIKTVISKLSSDSALKVKLSIVRNKSEKFDVVVKKSVIQLQSVKTDFIDDIAIIRITHFNEGTVIDMSSAIKKALKGKATGVILDLRNNPGGIMEQAVRVCDLFLGNNKKIIDFQSRNKSESRSIFADEIDLLNGLPMAILIDSNTASGAELVATSLGDNKRAVLIGEKTYGKGSLQTIIPIPGRGAIKLTTAYFVSPNGKKIDQVGVSPDIEILKADQDNNIQLQAQPQQQGQKIDPVIQRAVDLLHGLSVLSDDGKKDEPQEKDASSSNR